MSLPSLPHGSAHRDHDMRCRIWKIRRRSVLTNYILVETCDYVTKNFHIILGQLGQLDFHVFRLSQSLLGTGNL